MYISLQEEDRIAIYTMTPKTGKLKHQGDVELKGRPAPIAIDPEHKYLFAGQRKVDYFGMASFSIDRKTGGLMPIGSIPLNGDPVHISTDKTGKFLLSAYYYQKTAAVHKVGDDGSLADPPVVWRETDMSRPLFFSVVCASRGKRCKGSFVLIKSELEYSIGTG